DRRSHRRTVDAARRRHRRPDREGRARLLHRRIPQPQARVRMARVLTTVEQVRAQFSALRRPLAFFDGPGGTQVPDSVIDAVAHYLRAENANTGGPFATSYATDEVLERAHATAALAAVGSPPSKQLE